MLTSVTVLFRHKHHFHVRNLFMSLKIVHMGKIVSILVYSVMIPIVIILLLLFKLRSYLLFQQEQL